MPASITEPFYFLKLGGSLITDKTTPSTPRPDTLARLAEEIAAARAANPTMQLVLGHGSGSFGHVPAKKYGTRQGVHTTEQWQGFATVWLHASRLTRFLIEALHKADVPAIAFSPSAGAISAHTRVATWDLRPLQAALDAGLVPIVHGDVAFDTELGGTILSTEDIFQHLAEKLRPHRVLIAGIEPGVWADYPACSQIIPTITTQTLEQFVSALKGSAATDVTGGMATKVKEMLALTEQVSGLDVLIFSGEAPGMVRRTLNGETLGTRLYE